MPARRDIFRPSVIWVGTATILAAASDENSLTIRNAIYVITALIKATIQLVHNTSSRNVNISDISFCCCKKRFSMIVVARRPYAQKRKHSTFYAIGFVLVLFAAKWKVIRSFFTNTLTD